MSKSIARMSLYHRRSIYKPTFSNTVSKSIGVLVVNSHCKDIMYGKDEIAISTEDEKNQVNTLFDHLKVDNRLVLEDKPFDELVEEFTQLHEEARNFQ